MDTMITEIDSVETTVSAVRRVALTPALSAARLRPMLAVPPCSPAPKPEVGLYGVGLNGAQDQMSGWHAADHGKAVLVVDAADAIPTTYNTTTFSTRLGPLTCSPPV